MDERFLEDIVSGIDDKYVNETASALYENESRNVTSSDDLVIVEKKNKKFPFALVSAAAVVIAVISVVVGVVLFNSQSINTLDGSQKQEYPLFHEEMLAVKKDGKWGYINKSGEWTIEPQFDEACAFQKNGYAIVGIETKDEKGSETMIYGLIDKSGSYVIEPTYDLFYPFDDNGLALINNYGSAWYIDISNNVLTKPGFTTSKTTRFWSNDYAVVGDQRLDGIKVGVIDSEGRYIIGPQYDNVFILENGLFEVQLTDVIYESTDEIGMTWERGIIDKDGNFILPIEFFEIQRGDDGIYAVQRYGDAYHVDKDGKPLYNQRFSHVSVFNEYGVAVARTKDDTYGLIDKSGNYIAEPVYDYIINWGSFGTYVVKKDGKYGFINYKNEKITDIVFEDAQIFSENGLAIVVKDGKYGCININGEFAVQPIYLSISSFTDGVAVAETKDGFILINEKGERITSKTYGYLGKIKNERVAFYDGKKTFGYLDYSGNVIFSQVFGEDVSLWVNPYSDDGYTVVNSLDNEGKIKGLGVIDHEGNFISDLSFGGYYTYEYIEEWTSDSAPDVVIKIPDNEDKPVSAITFPSSSHTNDITAYQVITDGMKLNAENIDLWLPYADNTGSSYLEWYITENENKEKIIKGGKRPQIMPPTGGNLSPEIYIGDSSLKNYSLLVDFRFGNVDTIKIGLYKDTFTTESDFSTDEPMLGWFELDSDGKLYRTGVFSTRRLVTDIGEIDKDNYHTIQIENKGGSLQLIFDSKNYGEIAKVDNNQYCAFGIGGFELEVREMAVYDIEKYDAPIFDFCHLPHKLQSEFLKAEIGTDIKDRERIGLISAFVTGDASLLPEDTDEDVRKIFEEIYSTIVIKDYFIDVADDSLHFIASHQGQSIVKPYDEYAIYDFDKPAVNLTHDDRYTGGSYVDYITDNTHSSNADVEFEIIRVNYSLDGRTTENVARIFKKGDRLHITEEYIHVYTFTQSGNCGTEPSEPPSILSSEEFWQTKIESDLSYDYLGSTELELLAEEVIYAYQKYLNEQNWELLNVLWYGNEMKWCGSKGDAESMFSDMKITSCKNVTEEEYADRFNIGINELIYHITYESDSMGEGSMFIRLKKDGANYYIKETFTG